MSGLEEQLQRWAAAGLVDDAAASAIRAHEAQRAVVAARPGGSRVSLQEVVAYAGAALALAGGSLLVSLHRDDLGLAGRLAVYLAITAAALVAAARLMRGGEAGRRAASGCVAVAVLGAGVAVGDASVTGGWFSVHHLWTQPVPPRTYDDADRTGDTALALWVVAGLALAATWWLRSGLLALLLTGAAFCGTLAAVTARNPGANATTLALVTCIPGAALVAVSLTRRLRGDITGEVLRFWGTLVPAAGLVSTNDDPQVILLTVLAGAISAGALLASLALNSNGLAVAGGLGLFGVVLDVGVRWFKGPLGLPLVLIAAGVALIGVAVLIQRIVSDNRGRSTQSPLRIQRL